MNFNENVIKGKWLEMKGDVQKAWGKITGDELEQTKGDVKAIAGLVQQRHGENQEQFNKKFSDIYNKYDAKKDAIVDDIKNKIKN